MHHRTSARRLAVISTAGIGLALAQAAPAAPATSSIGRVLRVGASEPLRTPSAAAAVAHDGDTVEIAADTYPGDVAVWSANHLTLRGMNGMAHLAANGKSAQQKAIWVIRGNDTLVEHVELSGCRVPDRNGAGIRQEGRGLTVRHCSFHDNEDGILTGADPQSDILIEFSEFHHNGAGDGYSHNLYIGQVRSFTLQFCASHHAKTGHLVKSRAQSNFILYNRLMDEEDGASSYVIDLPNGGRSMIIGNIIQHGAHAENGVAISYAAEGAKNASQELQVVNNTYINERKASAVFLRVAGQNPTVRAINNLVVGSKSVLAGPGESSNNLVTDAPGFADAARHDFRLVAQSPARGAGIDPGKSGEFNLTPAFFYLDPLGSTPRAKGDKLNIGACPVSGK